MQSSEHDRIRRAVDWINTSTVAAFVKKDIDEWIDSQVGIGVQGLVNQPVWMHVRYAIFGREAFNDIRERSGESE